MSHQERRQDFVPVSMSFTLQWPDGCEGLCTPPVWVSPASGLAASRAPRELQTHAASSEL